jgi:hypothetical protein
MEQVVVVVVLVIVQLTGLLLVLKSCPLPDRRGNSVS